MAYPEDHNGGGTPPSEESRNQEPKIYDGSPEPYNPGDHPSSEPVAEPPAAAPEPSVETPAVPEPAPESSPEPYVQYSGNELDPAPLPPPPAPPAPPKKQAPPPEPDPDDAEEDGMAKMSFLDHLEELRSRLLRAIAGIGIAALLSFAFSERFYRLVQEPARAALTKLGVNPPELIQISPMDVFQIVWIKLPILVAVFIASPWVLYQLWAFISPGLYKRERRLAIPFVLSSAGLFILGGLFAYFIAFRYGLEFLLGIGLNLGIKPTISVTEYFDLFVDVMLGVGIVFEIPVLLFMLTLVRIVNPGFLVRHSRYAILVIVILAAVITPTGDVFNLALFATPMIVLFYVGIFASWLLVLKREKKSFPWGKLFKWFVVIVLVLFALAFITSKYYGYRLVAHWPYFVR